MQGIPHVALVRHHVEACGRPASRHTCVVPPGTHKRRASVYPLLRLGWEPFVTVSGSTGGRVELAGPVLDP
eukprot:8232748-Pyramimonas_sp.AAC.1